jgi:hypothetical protein
VGVIPPLCVCGDCCSAVGDVVGGYVNELRLGFSNTTRSPEGILRIGLVGPCVRACRSRGPVGVVLCGEVVFGATHPPPVMNEDNALGALCESPAPCRCWPCAWPPSARPTPSPSPPSAE